MRRRSGAALAVLAAVFLFTGPAQAKVLAGRLGLGFNSQVQTVFQGVDQAATFASHSVSVKYWFDEAMGVQGLLGFNVRSHSDDEAYDLIAGGKFLYDLVQEENMNFYLGGGAALLLVGYEGKKHFENKIGVSIFPAGGFEWFFAGLPNLGFMAEVGIQYSHIDASNQVGSYGGAFGTFGIHYYF